MENNEQNISTENRPYSAQQSDDDNSLTEQEQILFAEILAPNLDPNESEFNSLISDYRINKWPDCITWPNNRKWYFSAAYKKGFTEYGAKLQKSTTTIPQESFVFSIEETTTIESCIEYVNSSPFWIESLAKRKISDNGLLVTGLEFGQRKNMIFYNNIKGYENTNTSYGLILGYEYQAIERKKFVLSASANLLGELSTNKSVNLIAENQPHLITTESAENISQNEKNNQSLVTEFNTTLLIKIHQDLGLQIKPFYKMNLSEKHPSSALFDGGEHWGVGLGLRF